MQNNNEGECYLTPKEEILLNQVAQGLASQSSLLHWFNNLSATEKEYALKEIAYWPLAQSHPRGADFQEAMNKSGVDPTSSAARLFVGFTGFELQDDVATLLKLSTDEYENVLKLFTALLGIADGRRKKKCEALGVCSHWWHQDLNNAELIKKLIKNNLSL